VQEDDNADERKWPQMNANAAETRAIAVRRPLTRHHVPDLPAWIGKIHQQTARIRVSTRRLAEQAV